MVMGLLLCIIIVQESGLHWITMQLKYDVGQLMCKLEMMFMVKPP